MIERSADSFTRREVAVGGGRNERSPLRGVGIGNCRGRMCVLSSGGFESVAASSECVSKNRLSSWNSVGRGSLRRAGASRDGSDRRPKVLPFEWDSTGHGSLRCRNDATLYRQSSDRKSVV